MSLSDSNETTYAPEELLGRAIESLRQETASIQIQGRPLFEQEKARIAQIDAAVESIDKALQILQS